jgi:hypothetical protein
LGGSSQSFPHCKFNRPAKKRDEMIANTISEYAEVKVRVGVKGHARSAYTHNPHDPVIQVEKGGTLTLVNDSPDCSEFEVVFADCEPPNGSDQLTGRVGEPIVLHMPMDARTFAFYVRHKNKDGHYAGQELMLARSCGPCK